MIRLRAYDTRYTHTCAEDTVVLPPTCSVGERGEQALPCTAALLGRVPPKGSTVSCFRAVGPDVPGTCQACGMGASASACAGGRAPLNMTQVRRREVAAPTRSGQCFTQPQSAGVGTQEWMQ